MADTYTWGIANLERHLSDGIVYTVHWTLSAERTTEDIIFTAGSYGSLGLAAPEGNVIPYEDLTPEIVIGWTQDAFGEEKVVEMEAALSSSLDEQENPTDASGVPW
jgi:hypothetical protein